MTSKKAALWIAVATVLLIALAVTIFAANSSQGMSQTICDIFTRRNC